MLYSLFMENINAVQPKEIKTMNQERQNAFDARKFDTDEKSLKCSLKECKEGVPCPRQHPWDADAATIARIEAAFRLFYFQMQEIVNR